MQSMLRAQGRAFGGGMKQREPQPNRSGSHVGQNPTSTPCGVYPRFGV